VQLPKRLEHGEEVSLVEHLTELRQRLVVAVIALGVGFVIAFWRNSDILRLFNRQLPIDPHTHHHILPTTLSVSEPFTNSMIISAYAGLLLALPIVFYQLYAFVIPAFSDTTSKHIWPIMLIVPLLFVAGVAFGYEIVLPRAVNFLLGFNASQYNVQVRASSYYSFACMILAAMGLIFEMPAAVAALTRVGILSAALMRRHRRYAIVVLAAIAALLPGVDPVSMLLEFLPLLVLYEVSIWVARLVELRRDRVTEEEPVPGAS
jgi:sec-independent protein translocase protein TatC